MIRWRQRCTRSTGADSRRKTQTVTCVSHFTATGCIVSQVQAWLPVAVDNRAKVAHSRTSDLNPCYILCSKLAGALFNPSVSLVIVAAAFFCQTAEGYRVTRLSSRSVEEMRRRCMVRMMFTKWLLPHTQPSGSARQNRHTWVCFYRCKVKIHCLIQNDMSCP